MTGPLLQAVTEPSPRGGGGFGGFDALTAELSGRELLVRETVQNSWDARDDQRPDGTPVGFHLWGDILEGERLESLRRLLGTPSLRGFPGTFPNIHREDPASILAGERVPILLVADRWTVGLGGPTEGGKVDYTGQRTRFSNFMRDFGRPNTEGAEGDGGAFGIGKTVLWRFSDCSTVLVHTRTRGDHGLEERVLGKTIGPSFDDDDTRYTGRHFFGRPDGDGFAAAITSADDDFPAIRAELDRIGMPDHEGEACGTTVLVIGAAFGDDPLRTMEGLRLAIRWHAWPKYTPLPSRWDKPEMAFDVRWQGTSMDIPPVDEDDELAPYAAALRAAHLDADADLHPRRGVDLRCGRPDQRLGGVRIEPVHAEGGRPFQAVPHDEDLDDEDPLAPVATWGDNIAFVRRRPLLLVNYLPITAPAPDPDTQRCGVFLNDSDEVVNSALRTAEPPAHDRWVPERLPTRSRGDSRRTFVKQVVNKLAWYARTLGEERTDTPSGDTGIDVLGWSRLLFTGMPAVAGVAGTGPAVVETAVSGPPTNATSSRARWAAIRVLERTHVDGRTIHLLAVSVPDDGTVLTPQISVAARDATRGGSNLSMKDVPGVRFEWVDDAPVDGVRRLEVSGPDRYALGAEVMVGDGED